MNRREALKTTAAAGAVLSSFAALACIKAGEECLDHCVRSLSTCDKMMAECAGTVRAMLPLCHAVVGLARLDSPHLKATAAVCAKA